MELRHLRYFVAVADDGSFVAASRRLYVSQSAISEQIADLERELGGSLFSRSSRRLSLTPQGRVFLDEARKILSASSHAVATFQRSMAGELGTLSIGFFAWGVGPYFARIIRAFRETHPGVYLELHELLTRDQLDALGSGRIDVGFGRPIEPPFDRLFCSETLYAERMMILLPASHPLAGRPVQAAELASEHFVMRERTGLDHRYDDIVRICSDAGFEPDIVSTAKSWGGVVSLVEAGVGIALAPIGIRRIAGAGVSIQPVLPDATDVGIAITWNPANESRLLKDFLQLVQTRKEEIARYGRE